MSLGENVRLIRADLNMTRAQLVASSGVSSAQLSRIERGEQSNPNLDTLIALSKALKCTLDELVFEKAKPLQPQVKCKLVELRRVEEITGKPIGRMLLDPDSVELVEEYDSPLYDGCFIRLKPIVTGFSGDNDVQFLMQKEYMVAENLDDIDALLSSVGKG